MPRMRGEIFLPQQLQGDTLAAQLAVDAQVAVGTAVTCRPPHRSVRAELPHTAPASGM
jgi:hypothetical protein